MKNIGAQVTRRDLAVHQISAFRRAKQLPAFCSKLLAVPIAIGAHAAREQWPAVPTSIVHWLFAAKQRCQVLFDCLRRWSLDDASDFAATAFNYHRGNVGYSTWLNCAHRLVKLIVNAY